MTDKSKYSYWLNEDDVAVRIGETPSDCIVFDTVSKRFITAPTSMAAHVFKAERFASSLTEEEFNQIIANSLNNLK